MTGIENALKAIIKNMDLLLLKTLPLADICFFCASSHYSIEKLCLMKKPDKRNSFNN